MDKENPSSLLERINENDKSPNVSFVNLMDPSVEPMTSELEAMMKDVQARVMQKWHRACAAYLDSLTALIKMSSGWFNSAFWVRPIEVCCKSLKSKLSEHTL